MNQDIRWLQRYQNFIKAHDQLKKGLDIAKPNDIEKQGIIQSFEFTFELGWKTLKDYLQENDVDAKFPREVIKKAFQYEIVQDGEVWLEMLNKRNLMVHTYDEDQAALALHLIRTKFFPELVQLKNFFEGKS